MTRYTKKLLAWVLAFTMVWGMMPTQVIAESLSTPTDVAQPAEPVVEEPAPETPAEEPVPETPAEEPAPETPVEEPVPEPPVEEPTPETPVEEPAPEEPTAPVLADFELSLSEGELTVVRYTGSAGAVTVPGEVEGLPVTAIATGAFKDCGAEKITVKSGVKQLASGAFDGCDRLTLIVLPASVRTIAADAVKDCPLAVVDAAEGTAAYAWAEEQGLLPAEAPVEEPATDEPVAEEPADDEPVADEPANDEPANDEPVAAPIAEVRIVTPTDLSETQRVLPASFDEMYVMDSLENGGSDGTDYRYVNDATSVYGFYRHFYLADGVTVSANAYTVTARDLNGVMIPRVDYNGDSGDFWLHIKATRTGDALIRITVTTGDEEVHKDIAISVTDEDVGAIPTGLILSETSVTAQAGVPVTLPTITGYTGDTTTIDENMWYQPLYRITNGYGFDTEVSGPDYTFENPGVYQVRVKIGAFCNIVLATTFTVTVGEAGTFDDKFDVVNECYDPEGESFWDYAPECSVWQTLLYVVPKEDSGITADDMEMNVMVNSDIADAMAMRNSYPNGQAVLLRACGVGATDVIVAVTVGDVTYTKAFPLTVNAYPETELPSGAFLTATEISGAADTAIDLPQMDFHFGSDTAKQIVVGGEHYWNRGIEISGLSEGEDYTVEGDTITFQPGKEGIYNAYLSYVTCYNLSYSCRFTVRVGGTDTDRTFDDLFTVVNECYGDDHWFYAPECSAWQRMVCVYPKAEAGLYVSNAGFSVSATGAEVISYEEDDHFCVELKAYAAGDAVVTLTASKWGNLYTKELPVHINAVDWDVPGNPSLSATTLSGHAGEAITLPQMLFSAGTEEAKTEVRDNWDLNVYVNRLGFQQGYSFTRESVTFDAPGVYTCHMNYGWHYNMGYSCIFTVYVDVEPGSLLEKYELRCSMSNDDRRAFDLTDLYFTDDPERNQGAIELWLGLRNTENEEDRGIDYRAEATGDCFRFNTWRNEDEDGTFGLSINPTGVGEGSVTIYAVDGEETRSITLPIVIKDADAVLDAMTLTAPETALGTEAFDEDGFFHVTTGVAFHRPVASVEGTGWSAVMNAKRGQEDVLTREGDTYTVNATGLYSFQLMLKSATVTTWKTVYVRADKPGETAEADVDTYFELDESDRSTLYLAHGDYAAAATETNAMYLSPVNDAPFADADVHMTLTPVLAEGETASVRAWLEEPGENHAAWLIKAIGNEDESAQPGDTTYRLDVTVTQEGEELVQLTKELTFTARAIPEGTPTAYTVSSETVISGPLTASDHNPDELVYYYNLPTVTYEGTRPAYMGTMLYHLSQGERLIWEDAMSLVPGIFTGENMRRYATEEMGKHRFDLVYVLSLGNLSWEVPFTLLTDVTENDFEALFDVEEPDSKIYIGDGNLWKTYREAQVVHLSTSRNLRAEGLTPEAQAYVVSGDDPDMELIVTNSAEEAYWEESWGTDIDLSVYPKRVGTTVVHLDVTVGDTTYGRDYTVTVEEMPADAPVSINCDVDTLEVTVGEWITMPAVTLYTASGEPVSVGALAEQLGTTVIPTVWSDSGLNTIEGSDSVDAKFSDAGVFTTSLVAIVGRNVAYETRITLLVRDEQGKLPLRFLNYQWDQWNTRVDAAEGGTVGHLEIYGALAESDMIGLNWDVMPLEGEDAPLLAVSDSRMPQSYDSGCWADFSVEPGTPEGTYHYDLTYQAVDKQTGNMLAVGGAENVAVTVVNMTHHDGFARSGVRDFVADENGHATVTRLTALDDEGNPVDPTAYDRFYSGISLPEDSEIELSGSQSSLNDYAPGETFEVTVPKTPGVYLIHDFVRAEKDNDVWEGGASIRIWYGTPDLSVFTLTAKEQYPYEIALDADQYPLCGLNFYMENLIGGDWVDVSLEHVSGDSVSLVMYDTTSTEKSWTVEDSDDFRTSFAAQVSELRHAGDTLYRMHVTVTTAGGMTLTDTVDMPVKVIDSTQQAAPVVTFAQHKLETTVNTEIALPAMTVEMNGWQCMSTYWHCDGDALTLRYTTDPETHVSTGTVSAVEPGVYCLTYEVLSGMKLIYDTLLLVVRDEDGTPIETQPALHYLNTGIDQTGNTFEMVSDALGQWQYLGVVTLEGLNETLLDKDVHIDITVPEGSGVRIMKNGTRFDYWDVFARMDEVLAEDVTVTATAYADEAVLDTLTIILTSETGEGNITNEINYNQAFDGVMDYAADENGSVTITLPTALDAEGQPMLAADYAELTAALTCTYEGVTLSGAVEGYHPGETVEVTVPADKKLIYLTLTLTYRAQGSSIRYTAPVGIRVWNGEITEEELDIHWPDSLIPVSADLDVYQCTEALAWVEILSNGAEGDRVTADLTRVSGDSVKVTLGQGNIMHTEAAAGEDETTVTLYTEDVTGTEDTVYRLDLTVTLAHGTVIPASRELTFRPMTKDQLPTVTFAEHRLNVYVNEDTPLPAVTVDMKGLSTEGWNASWITNRLDSQVAPDWEIDPETLAYSGTVSVTRPGTYYVSYYVYDGQLDAADTLMIVATNRDGSTEEQTPTFDLDCYNIGTEYLWEYDGSPITLMGKGGWQSVLQWEVSHLDESYADKDVRVEIVAPDDCPVRLWRQARTPLTGWLYAGYDEDFTEQVTVTLRAMADDTEIGSYALTFLPTKEEEITNQNTWTLAYDGMLDYVADENGHVTITLPTALDAEGQPMLAVDYEELTGELTAESESVVLTGATEGYHPGETVEVTVPSELKVTNLRLKLTYRAKGSLVRYTDTTSIRVWNADPQDAFVVEWPEELILLGESIDSATTGEEWAFFPQLITGDTVDATLTRVSGTSADVSLGSGMHRVFTVGADAEPSCILSMRQINGAGDTVYRLDVTITLQCGRKMSLSRELTYRVLTAADMPTVTFATHRLDVKVGESVTLPTMTIDKKGLVNAWSQWMCSTGTVRVTADTDRTTWLSTGTVMVSEPGLYFLTYYVWSGHIEASDTLVLVVSDADGQPVTKTATLVLKDFHSSATDYNPEYDGSPVTLAQKDEWQELCTWRVNDLDATYADKDVRVELVAPENCPVQVMLQRYTPTMGYADVRYVEDFTENIDIVIRAMADDVELGRYVLTFLPTATSIPATGITLTADSTIDLDSATDTLTVTAQVKPAGAKQQVDWEIIDMVSGCALKQDAVVATLTGDALTATVKGVNRGTFKVRATAKDDSGVTATTDTITVTKQPTALAAVTLTPGMTGIIDLTALGAKTWSNITYTTTDAAATVDAAGTVTAVSAGTATVNVETDDPAKFGTAIVTVLPLTEAAVQAEGEAVTELTVQPGEDQTLTLLAGYREDGAFKPVTTLWTAQSDKPDVAACTVSGNTLTVKPLTVGIATITVTTRNGVTATLTMIVHKRVTAIALDAAEAVLSGETAQFTATITPADANNQTLVWRVTDAAGQPTTLATVDQTGLLTAGNVTARTVLTVWAKAQDGSAVEGKRDIALLPRVASIAITETGEPHTTLNAKGEHELNLVDYNTVTLTAAVLPGDADQTAIWTSSDETVATVSDGVVTALKLGRTTITAASAENGDITDTFLLYVRQPAVKTIALDGADTIDLDTNDTITITATVTPATALQEVDWAIIDMASGNALNPDAVVATIEGGKLTATVTGLCRGTFKVQASAKDDSGVTASTGDITVIRADTQLTDLTLTSGMTADIDVTALGEADWTRISYTAVEDGAADIATVTADGRVTAVAPGELHVRVETDTDRLGVCTITVLPLTQAGFYDGDNALTELDSAPNTTETLTLKASYAPEEGETTFVPADWKVTGTNPAVLSFTLEGDTLTLTPVAAGTAILTAKTQNGVTATLTVVVTTRLTALTLSAPETLLSGTKTTVVPTFTPANATDKTLNWRVTDQAGEATEAATIAGGVLTAGQVDGRTTVVVHATTCDGSDIEATAKVDILPLANTVIITEEPDDLGHTHTTQDALGRYALDLGVYSTAKFSAVILPADAAQDIKWTSSAPTVAKVEDGLVTVLKLGTAVITAASVENGATKASITLVARNLVSGVTVSDATGRTSGEIVAGLGRSVQLTAAATPVNATYRTVSWFSSDPEAAVVSSTGKVTVPADYADENTRRVTIRATAADGSDCYGEYSLTVYPKAAGVTMTLEGYDIGDDHALTIDLAELMDDTGAITPIRLTYTMSPIAAKQGVTWAVTRTDLATVADEGDILLRLKKPGTFRLTATALDGSNEADYLDLTVTCLPASIAVTGPTALASGKSGTFKAAVTPTVAANRSVTWAIYAYDEGSDSAQTDDEGNPVKYTLGSITTSGTVTLRATADDPLVVRATSKANPEVYGEAVVKVEPLAYRAAITIADGSESDDYRLDLNEDYDREVQLAAAFTAKNGAELENTSAAWSSDKSAVAKVSADGLVTAVAPGSAYITAKATDGSGVYTKVKVTVVCVPESMEIVSADTLVVGKSLTLKASILPALASNKQVTYKVTSVTVGTAEGVTEYTAAVDMAKWVTLTGSTLKAVKASGAYPTTVMVHAVSKGNAEVTADAEITLLPKATGAVVESLSKTDEGNDIHAINIGLGESELALSATVKPAMATQRVKWTTSNAAVATVDADGVVTAVKTGKVTIKATTVDGTAKVSNAFAVTVGVMVQNVTIAAPAMDSLTCGKTLTLTASALPLNATTRTISWSSSNTAVATVSAGKVTTKTVTKPTEVTITAKAADGSGVLDTITLTVLPKTTSVKLYKDEEMTMAAGAVTINMNDDPEDMWSFQLFAKCIATGGEPAQEVTWKSSVPSVAAISQDGVVTAKKAGTTYVYAVAKDGSAKVSTKYLVTVKCLPVEVEITGPEEAARGKKVTLKATVYPTTVASQSVTWGCLDTTLATISTTGVVTVKSTAKVGSTIRIRATTKVNGVEGVKVKSEMFYITVTSTVTTVLTNLHDPDAPTAVPTMEMHLYGADEVQGQLSATTLPVTAAQAVTWKSSNTKIATVDEYGLVTAIHTGTVYIYAIATDGSAKKATVKVVVD